MSRTSLDGCGANAFLHVYFKCSCNRTCARTCTGVGLCLDSQVVTVVSVFEINNIVFFVVVYFCGMHE